MSLKWYKRDPRAALAGMMTMSLEECGAYNKILDLIYLRGGKLLDDAAEICRWLNCDPRTWRRIRARLIDMEKIYVHAGGLCNERATEEIEKFETRARVCSEAAVKRWATYNEIKELPNGYPMLTRSRLSKLSAKIVPLSSGNREKEPKK